MSEPIPESIPTCAAIPRVVDTYAVIDVARRCWKTSAFVAGLARVASSMRDPEMGRRIFELLADNGDAALEDCALEAEGLVGGLDVVKHLAKIYNGAEERAVRVEDAFVDVFEHVCSPGASGPMLRRALSFSTS